MKGGHDDSAVVIRVLEAYLNPMQQKMLSVAPELKIAGREKSDRVKLLPLLMKVSDSGNRSSCLPPKPSLDRSSFFVDFFPFGFKKDAHGQNA